MSQYPTIEEQRRELKNITFLTFKLGFAFGKNDKDFTVEQVNDAMQEEGIEHEAYEAHLLQLLRDNLKFFAE